jgi:very-short-patch-repair endonuclease
MHLRTSRGRVFHVRRQAPRDGYILDFVCLAKRLIVEVDGGQHNRDDHAPIDRERDRHFEAQGFKALRFWNSDVDRNVSGVLERIDRELHARGDPIPALRAIPPPAGEG